jgi:5-(carboxyamino)imidazole ribonucleotide synthase
MKPILPGATIGILGGGQLGRMLTLVAKRLGYRVTVFEPSADSPAAQVADCAVVADYDDIEALTAFAKQVDVVTLEFENIPVSALEVITTQTPVFPEAQVLYITQNRLREKTFLHQAGFPVVPFQQVDTTEALPAALGAIGLPAVIKTAGFGYDGKGQRIVDSPQAAQAAHKELGGGTVILEAFIQYQTEVSVVAARGHDGRYQDFGVIENHHHHHILDISLAPAQVSERVAVRAREWAREVLEHLGVVGVSCVEFFVVDGALLINEIAPRPHNSGHLTIEACQVSQFEQQLRAVCGLPLAHARYQSAAAMVNLLGDLWQSGQLPWDEVLARDVHLHLYGKADARPGRKMGHITALATGVQEARVQALAARQLLEDR